MYVAIKKQCHSERSEESRVHKVGVTEILRYALDDKMIRRSHIDTPLEVLKTRTFVPSCLFLLERTINEQSRKQNKMEMGDYRTDSHVGGGILHPSLKIIGIFQRFFRIKPFLCRKKGQES